MSTSSDPRHGHPSTHFIQYKSDRDALMRLPELDHLIINGMGGTLPEQGDPNRLRSVLDASYDSGNWLIEVARAYPDIPRLVGIGASKPIIEYARSQIAATHLAERIEFQVMDILGRLNFPYEDFDLVNLRMAHTYLRTWDWPYLLSEFRRVARPGATIRLTESDVLIESNSPALTQLHTLMLQALYRSGHLFTEDTQGINAHLTSLLQRANLRDIKERAYTLDFHAGTPETQQLYENQKFLFRTMLPFFQKWLRLPDDYETIYQQALAEMQQPDFAGQWRFVTAWGQQTPINPL